MSSDTLEIDFSVSSNRHVTNGKTGITISFDCKPPSKENLVRRNHRSTSSVFEGYSHNIEPSKNVKNDDSASRNRAAQQGNNTNEVRKKCNYFKKYGECKFENECTFSHDIASASNSVVRHEEEKPPNTVDADEKPPNSAGTGDEVKWTNRRKKNSFREQQPEFGMQVYGFTTPFGNVFLNHDGKNINNVDGSYLHTKSMSNVSCKFFLEKMGCIFGDKCQYKHNSSVIDTGVVFLNDLSHLNNTEAKKAKLTEVNEKTNPSDKQLSAEKTDPNDSKTNKENVEPKAGSNKKNKKVDQVKPVKRCTFYLKRNGCPKGDNCKFIHLGKVEGKTDHEGSNNVDNRKSSDESSNNVDSRNSSGEASNNVDNRKSSNKATNLPSNTDVREKNYKTKKCKYHERGKCRRGDSCTFIHRPKRDANNSSDASSKTNNHNLPDDDVRKDNKSAANNSESTESKKHSNGGGRMKKCRYFRTPRGCIKDDCPFLHEKLVDKETEGNQSK